MTDKEYQVPEHAPYNLGEEIVKEARRKRRARLLIRISTFVIVVLVIISYLGFALGQYFANATSLSVRTRVPQIRFSQVGFRLSNPIDSTDSYKYNLQLDDGGGGITGPGYVYWTNQDVSPQTLSFILRHEKYSDNSRLNPVTSRAFAKDKDKDEPITLYDRPRMVTMTRWNVEETIAETQDYFGIKVLFRLLIENDVAGQVSLDNIGVYFARDTKFSGSNNITKAMRLGFQSAHTKDIISPGRKEPKVNDYLNFIDVGGRLDLDGKESPPGKHGYYDYTLALNGSIYDDTPGEHLYEIAYGDFEPALTNANWGPALTESTEIPENNDVFNAASFKGVRPLINATPARQYYTNFDKYTLINNEGEAIAFTNEYGVAELDIKIWLEGWDQFTTDKLVGATFGAQLRFEVAKKDLGS